MSDDSDDVAELRSEVDELRALTESLRRKRIYLQERVNDVELENEDLREELSILLIAVDPGSGDWESLTKAWKVHQAHVSLAKRALKAQDGKARMQYTDVMWLFDGHPSAGHCYDLMKRGAELGGFEYNKPAQGGGQIRIRVDLTAVSDETVIHAANKEIQDEEV